MAASECSTTSKPLSIVDRIKEKVEIAMAPLRKMQSTALKRKACDNQGDYIARLESFNRFAGSYSCFPDKISPVILAQHGWSVYDEFTVKCKTCNAFLSIKVPPTTADNQKETNLSIKYVTTHLKTAHKPSCKWSTTLVCSLPDEGYSFIRAFESFKAFLLQPIVEIPMISTPDDEGSQLLPATTASDLKPYLEDDERACLLSLFGWHPDGCHIKCRFCAIKRCVKPYLLDSKFNPLQAHERFCPVRLNKDDHVISVVLRLMSEKRDKNIGENLSNSYDFIDGFESAKRQRPEAEDADEPIKVLETDVEAVSSEGGQIAG